MAISREKEQAEQNFIGPMPTWASLREFRIALQDMTTQAYNAYVVQFPQLSGLSRTDAIALVLVRENDLMGENLVAFDVWRRTP